MGIKLNVGASPIWSKNSWMILDHKASRNSDIYIKGDASNINLDSDTCDLLFCSHMLEHVPHYKIQKTLTEFSRVLKEGGTLRIVLPDLRRIATAYVNNDIEFFTKALTEDKNIRQDLGIGGMFMNFVVSPGQDTILLDRNLENFIGGYAHLYAYDFNMMKTLLEIAGFTNITESQFCSSAIDDFREPMHVAHLPPIWEPFTDEFFTKNNLIHEYKDGRYEINFNITGFDKNPITSLIIEATKNKTVVISDENNINGDAFINYNKYGQSVLYDESIATKLKEMKISTNLWNT